MHVFGVANGRVGLTPMGVVAVCAKISSIWGCNGRAHQADSGVVPVCPEHVFCVIEGNGRATWGPRALNPSAKHIFPREKMKESLCIGLICFFLYSYMSLIPWYALIIASKCKYMGNIYALLVSYIFMIALCICLSALYTIFIYTWYMVKDNDTRYMYTDICIYG